MPYLLVRNHNICTTMNIICALSLECRMLLILTSVKKKNRNELVPKELFDPVQENMSLWSTDCLEHEYDLIVDYVFRTCIEDNDKSIPTDMKNLIIKYLLPQIHLFTDNYPNLYCNFLDIFPDISKSTWKILEIYPNTVKTLSSFQLFPYQSTDAAIHFYDLHGGYLFQFSFKHVYRTRKAHQFGERGRRTIRMNNICQAELGKHDGTPETLKRQIMRQIVTSCKFEAFCKEHDIICHHYIHNLSTYQPYIIGFNKFPAELVSFLYQQFNQLYTSKNGDNDNDQTKGKATASAITKTKQGELGHRSSVKLVRMATDFTFIGELGNESNKLINSDHNQTPFLYFNKKKFQNNNHFKFSNFIKNELKLKYTMTKKIKIIDKNSNSNSNIKRKDNYNNMIDGEFSIRMWNYDIEAYNYSFEFGHGKRVRDNMVLNLDFTFHESNENYNGIFYHSCMSLINAKLNVNCINQPGNRCGRKFTKKALNGYKNASDKSKRRVRAKVFDTKYNQVVTSQKKFDALLNVCDNILKFFKDDTIPDPKITLKMGVKVVYP